MTVQQALLATWPPLRLHEVGPWTIAEGAGGGKRVSCAFAREKVTDKDIPLAENGQAELGQSALFMLGPKDHDLDLALDARGYQIVDPCHLYMGDLAALSNQPVDRMASFPHWPPMAVTKDIWQSAGIGAARIAVMTRAKGPKTVILGRIADHAAGAAYIAVDQKIAMLHALEILPPYRRLGLGRQILCAAADWARDQGATQIGLAATRSNTPAHALYTAFGMKVVDTYHYRKKPD